MSVFQGMGSDMFDRRSVKLADIEQKGCEKMNYEQLKQINDEMNITPVKTKNGQKPYVQVNDRVQGFRKLYPEGIIKTEMVVYIPDDYCVFKCEVYNNEVGLLATGYAQETVEKNKNINRTSMLENCETSAVGRALGFLGIGSVDSIASADEVNKAMNKGAELDSTITDDMAADLVRDLMEAGQSPDTVCRFNKVQHLNELTVEQYNNVVKRYLKK